MRRTQNVVGRHTGRLGAGAFVVLITALALGLVAASPAVARDGALWKPLTPKEGKQLWRGSDLSGANGIYVGPDGRVYTASVVGNEITVQHPGSGEVLDRIGPERGGRVPMICSSPMTARSTGRIS